MNWPCKARSTAHLGWSTVEENWNRIYLKVWDRNFMELKSSLESLR